MVVNAAAAMSPGKLGAQTGHAAAGLLRFLLELRPPWMSAWESGGEKMVVLAGEASF